MQFTLAEILAGLGGSAGLIVGLITLFNAVTTRLDSRKQRKEAGDDKRIANTAEIKRIQSDSEGREKADLVANLWKIIELKNAEIEKLKIEVDEIETKSTFSRPLVTRIYNHLREIRKAMDSINIIVLTDDETNMVMRHFQTMKVNMDDLEKILP